MCWRQYTDAGVMQTPFTHFIMTQGREWLTYLEHDQEEDDPVDEDEEDAWDCEDEYDSDVEYYISFQR